MNESWGGTEEGRTKTGLTEVMQVNVPGDWKSDGDTKAYLGMTYKQEMTPETSINFGLKYLFLKGMVSSDNGEMSWRDGVNGGWIGAAVKYNGKGDKNYKKKLESHLSNMSPGKSQNYGLQ